MDSNPGGANMRDSIQKRRRPDSPAVASAILGGLGGRLAGRIADIIFPPRLEPNGSNPGGANTWDSIQVSGARIGFQIGRGSRGWGNSTRPD